MIVKLIEDEKKNQGQEISPIGEAERQQL